MHNFSVVVCTRDRAHILEDALDSLLAQEYPKDRYEIIIVDNESTDGTRAVVEHYARVKQDTQISSQLERRRGASFARNRGIETARYDYVAFLDDDTIAPPGWLSAYDSALCKHDIVAAGGPVFATFEPGVERPSWWSDVEGLFSFDHGHVEPARHIFRLRWPLWLGGCNSVYSKKLLQDHGAFRTDFGPIGRRYRIAEDIDLNVRLERAGVPIYLVRNAWIKHRITADRLLRRSIWRRTYCAGITDAHGSHVLGIRSDRRNLQQLARSFLELLRCGETARTRALGDIAYRLGYLRQSWRIALRGTLTRR